MTPATRRSLALPACAAALLALHAWLALSAVAGKSPSYDEPLHLTAGYSYWQYDDFRLQPENGNLPQRWATLPLLWQDARFGASAPEAWWGYSDFPRLKDHFLYGSGNDPDRMFAAARTAAMLWGVALGLLVFCWSRRLWGDGAACFALALYALSPTMLAHGPLVTSDMCAAFFLVAASGAYWRHLQRLTPGSLALSALVTGLAVVAKFSFVVLPFVFGLLALWVLVERRPRAAWLAASAAVHLAVTWVIVWGFYGWRFAAAGDELPAMMQFYRLWSHILPAEGPVRAVVDLAREWRLLPEAFIHGFSFVYTAAQARPAFLNGEFGDTGWWWFFPYAYLIKTPIAELLALATGAGLVITRWVRVNAAGRLTRIAADLRTVLPLAALLLVYGALSVTSSLNIGHRHLLPMYPALFILAGGLVAVPLAPWRRWAAVALVLLATVESFAVRPHYLAFFNASVGGPSQGWRHLVDSSLDWGQDIPGLAKWLGANQRPGEALYVTVFSTASLEHHGVRGTLLPPSFDADPRPWVELDAGLYAVSATMLQDVYSPWRGAWSPQDETTYRRLGDTLHGQLASGALAPVINPLDAWGTNLRTLDRFRFARLVNYLRLRAPDAVVGYSIFVHRLDAAEIHAAVNGTTEEYVALIEGTP